MPTPKIREIDKQLEDLNKELDGLATPRDKQSPASIEADGSGPVWWSTTNAMTMSSVVLVFGAIVICIAAWLIRQGQNSTAILRVFGTVLILVMSVFLVVAGYDDKQIAPVLGLLGTVAGYLLGREANASAAPAKPPA